MMLARDDIKQQVTRMRTGFEIGAVVAAVIFAIGVIFSSGVQYSQLTNVQSVQATHAASIAMLQSQLMPINVQLAREDALLSDIRSELRLQSQHQFDMHHAMKHRNIE